MTAEELIKQLEKVQHKEAEVLFREGDFYTPIHKAVIEHDLADDKICVVLQE